MALGNTGHCNSNGISGVCVCALLWEWSSSSWKRVQLDPINAKVFCIHWMHQKWSQRRLSEQNVDKMKDKPIAHELYLIICKFNGSAAGHVAIESRTR